jgi:hypothetical protein
MSVIACLQQLPTPLSELKHPHTVVCMGQTLNINEPAPKRHPREIDFPWSFLFIPALLLLAGLSIPYVFVAAPVQRRREQKFQARMKARNRIVPWGEFRRAVDEGRGSLVVEQYDFKGPFHWWWTPEDIYSLCPVPVVEWIEFMPTDEPYRAVAEEPNDERYRPVAEWCHHRYTSEETGIAFLIEGIPAEEKIGFLEAAPAWLPERVGFMTVVLPKSLRTYKDAEA